MKVLNEYESHHYYQDYEMPGIYHCPSCGGRNIWHEQGRGDYYCGSDYICEDCENIWTMQGLQKACDREKRIIEQLKTGITFDPITPSGG